MGELFIQMLLFWDAGQTHSSRRHMHTLGLIRGRPVNASLSRSSNEMFAGGPTGPVTPLLAWVSAFQQTTCPMQRAKALSTKQKTCRRHCFPPSRLRQRLLRISWLIYTRLSLDHLDLLHRIHLDLRFSPFLFYRPYHYSYQRFSTATARLFTFHLRILPAEAHAISTYPSINKNSLTQPCLSAAATKSSSASWSFSETAPAEKQVYSMSLREDSFLFVFLALPHSPFVHVLLTQLTTLRRSTNPRFSRIMSTISSSMGYTWNYPYGTPRDRKSSIDCGHCPTTTHRR